MEQGTTFFLLKNYADFSPEPGLVTENHQVSRSPQISNLVGGFDFKKLTPKPCLHCNGI